MLRNVGQWGGGKLWWPYSQTWREGVSITEVILRDHFPFLLVVNMEHIKLNMPLWLYTILSCIFKRTHIQWIGEIFSLTKLFTWHIWIQFSVWSTLVFSRNPIHIYRINSYITRIRGHALFEWLSQYKTDILRINASFIWSTYRYGEYSTKCA